MSTLMQHMQNFIRDEEGVTAIEYALIAALIAVAATVMVTRVGTAVTSKFQEIGTTLGAP
ncbi:MAG TPA: Flp family type IVb pilin [Burkholderiaceae bacterium]